MDGMTALIVSPTRELAYQTYSVLKKIGHRHDFSAGLVIGGKVGLVCVLIGCEGVLNIQLLEWEYWDSLELDIDWYSSGAAVA